jgi:hypothetical protein
VRLARIIAALISIATAGAALSIAMTTGAFAATPNFKVVSGSGYSLKLPVSWRYWREENYGANAIAYFYYDPSIRWSVMTVMPDADGGGLCSPFQAHTLDLETPVEDNLNFPVERPPSAGGYHQLSRTKLAFEGIVDPDPLPDNGLVIAIPPVTNGCYVQEWWRIDLWLPESDHALATTILDSVNVS